MAIWSKLGKYQHTGLLIMRAGLGLMMILHGYPKLSGGPEKWEKLGGAMTYLGLDLLPAFWGFMASAAEGVGGLLVMLGLFFRPSCALIVITMIVAAMSHLAKGDGIMAASHAIETGVAFIGLMIIGPGKFSIDRS
jgi:putative oxidoreductase